MSNLGSSAYQPNALQLGQTGSLELYVVYEEYLCVGVGAVDVFENYLGILHLRPKCLLCRQTDVGLVLSL